MTMLRATTIRKLNLFDLTIERVHHHRLNILLHTCVFDLARPLAEAVEWLREMFDLMDNHGVYVGDGRTLEQICAALRLDPAALVAIAARTPQTSALKIFRLLYPTVASRAGCQSISRIPQEQLNDIYSKFSGIMCQSRN